MLSVAGGIRLNRKYCWSKDQGGVCPADALVGVERSNVSPGARELCVLMGMSADFDQASQDLKRVGGMSVSKERLRQMTEDEAKRVRAVRDEGRLAAAWSADDTKLADGRSRVYVGVDGVMAPTVTQVEKDKRRRKHGVRRRQRGAGGLGNAKPLPTPKPGSDERHKEMKIGVFYNQDKTLRQAFVTENPCKDFAPLLGSHARQIGFEKADQTICLIDGAPWIFDQVCQALLCLQVILLDFFHLAERVHATAQCCFGEAQAGRDWAHQRLEEAKSSDIEGMLRAIGVFEKRCRSPAKKESLRCLGQYIRKRRAMLDYAQARQAGWDIGSGPTEATCKTLTLRLKRPGMKWDSDNAAAIMNLAALRESGQWKAYWQQESRMVA